MLYCTIDFFINSELNSTSILINVRNEVIFLKLKNNINFVIILTIYEKEISSLVELFYQKKEETKIQPTLVDPSSQGCP